MKKAKILIVTDSAALPTGMAETTRLIFESILVKYAAFYEVLQIGLFHCYAVTQPKWVIYPTEVSEGRQEHARLIPEDSYAQRSFSKFVDEWQPDIVFAFGEPQRVAHLCQDASERNHSLILYTNFDGLPVRQDFADALRKADQIFTMTEFAKRVLVTGMPQISAEDVGVAYSPADTKRFAPVGPEAK